MEYSTCTLPTMMLGRFRGFIINSKYVINFYLIFNWSLNFEVIEPKLRPAISGPSVRILGMIDRLEPKVNFLSNIK